MLKEERRVQREMLRDCSFTSEEGSEMEQKKRGKTKPPKPYLPLKKNVIKNGSQSHLDTPHPKEFVKEK